jgi:hypothetical protein
MNNKLCAQSTEIVQLFHQNIKFEVQIIDRNKVLLKNLHLFLEHRIHNGIEEKEFLET